MINHMDAQLNWLRHVDPQRIVIAVDYDLTLANKSKVNFHEAPLTPEQHRGISRLAPQIGHFVVVTARGAESTSGYLHQHGAIDNLSLASNSGHLWHPHIAMPGSQAEIIAIPGYDARLLSEVTRAISGLVEKMYRRFPSITADPRELCGAVIYQFDGNEASAQHKEFHLAAAELRRELPAAIAERILFEAKHRVLDQEKGAFTQGYIDFKPHGMDKGLTTAQIFSQFVTRDTVLIVAGDSKPDYPMMQTGAQLVGRDRLICISVGDGLVEHDKDGLLNLVLKPNGHSPVDVLHQFLDRIGEPQVPAHIAAAARNRRRAAAGAANTNANTARLGR